MHCMYNSLWKD